MLTPETAWRSEWLDADEYPPPIGKKILLLTDCGIACIGHWYQPGFIAWSPLPKIPNAIKHKIDHPTCQKPSERPSPPKSAATII